MIGHAEGLHGHVDERREIDVTLDSPVAWSRVPLPSWRTCSPRSSSGKPLTGTGGPKKQLGSAQPPGAKQSPSLVHATLVVDAVSGRLRPAEQSRGRFRGCPTSVVPSGLSSTVVAFSGITEGLPSPRRRRCRGSRARGRTSLVRRCRSRAHPRTADRPAGRSGPSHSSSFPRWS